MRTAISFASPAEIETELLVALAADAQTPNGSDSKPRPTLLTAEAAVLAATASVLSTGEFKAGANETVLLHAPSGLAAKRLLIVGLGKLPGSPFTRCETLPEPRSVSPSLAGFARSC